MTHHDDGPLPDRVRVLAGPLAQALAIEVLDVEVTGSDSRPLVRVIVDTADPASVTGVDVDDIATLSRQLGDELDQDILLDSAYTLEVTSPGADRPLTDYRDFARNLGRDVRVHRRTPEAAADATDPTGVTGTLVDVDGDHVTLDADGTEIRVAFAELDHGRVVLPW